MVRSTIASMVRRTIANIVKQEQEAHNNRLGKPEKKQLGKLEKEQLGKLEKIQFGKSYNTEDAVAQTKPHACAVGRGFRGHGQEYHCQKGRCEAEELAVVVNDKLEIKAGLESQKKPKNLSKEKNVFPFTCF